MSKVSLHGSQARPIQSMHPHPTSRRYILILSIHIHLSFIIWIMEIFQDFTNLFHIYKKKFQELFLVNIYMLVDKVFTVWDDDILTM